LILNQFYINQKIYYIKFYSREAHSKLKCWWKNKFKHKITFNKKSFRLKYVILLLNILINNINV